VGNTNPNFFVNVLGDSHTRSFAYNHFFFPLFIGAGGKTCFYKESIAQEAYLRLKSNLTRLDLSNPVMFVLSEPDMRYILDIYEDESQIENEVLCAVNRYISVSEKLLDEFIDLDLHIYNSVPTERIKHNKYAQLYNAHLKRWCEDKGVGYVDIWDQLMDGEVVDPHFQADYIHLNHRVDSIVINYFQSRYDLRDFETSVPSQYKYLNKLNAGNFVSRIWGDFKKEDLFTTERTQRTWAFPLTKNAENAIKHLVPFFKISGVSKNESITILEDSEGFWGFKLESLGFNNVCQVFESEQKKEQFERVKRFTKSQVRGYLKEEFKNLNPNIVISIGSSLNWREKPWKICADFVKIDLNSLEFEDGLTLKEFQDYRMVVMTKNMIRLRLLFAIIVSRLLYSIEEKLSFRTLKSWISNRT